MAMDFMTNNAIEILDWPPYSPDISPIENVWAEMKRKLYRQGTPDSVDALIAQVLHLWNSDPDIHALCVKLCLGMCDRVSKVLRQKGGPIFY
jgi:transposase